MEVYGLIGNPVGHSLSPPMHEAGFRAKEIDARYVTFQPAKTEGEKAIRAAQTLGLGGLNVTIPFKEDAFTVVEPDAMAERVGAVNTIVFEENDVTGYNTDVEGVLRSFSHHGVTLASKSALVVGAGGAGKAVAVGLADAGASVSITNRTPERADAIAEAFDGVQAVPFEHRGSHVGEVEILVNATSVGMKTTESIVPADALHADLVVLDAVYRPLETRLLEDAHAAGAITIDGGWMLLFQGTAAFEHWTGVDAPVMAMNEALRSRL